MSPTYHANAQAPYNPAPSIETPARNRTSVAKAIPKSAGSVGVPVGSEGEVPRELGVDRAALRAAGFEGKVGQTLVIPRADGPALVAVGLGPRAELDAAKLRDAAAAFARAAKNQPSLATTLADAGGALKPDAAAQAVTEGVLLARYRYLAHKKPSPSESPLKELTLVSPAGPQDELKKGVERGEVMARAAYLSRDLANAPATLLTARRMADVAKDLAKAAGLEIEIFDEKQLLDMGCGGILGVNAGSAEPPRLIRLTYRPKGEPVGHIALVGKGIMYDSGGLSLKPNDLVHASMKVDMTGAADILAAMTALQALGCKSAVTGYLCCTDNMPGGGAMRLGDILTIRGGTTIEVLNTDAEGRLVLADGLVLATEQQPKPDAIVDIATLTGAAQRALGHDSAGLIGNHQGLVEQVKAAAERTDETVWQLPLDRRMRVQLDSDIADMKNVGGDNAGSTTAALFLEEFVAGLPWAHLDIAGTAKLDADSRWRSKGATGYGTRLLIDLLMAFTPPAPTRH